MVRSVQAADPAPPGQKRTVRVVSCDQKVRSRKRGICANRLEPADFAALAPGVSWWYNWHHEPSQTPPKGAALEFLPMAWADRPEDIAGLERYLAAGNRPRRILAINEPNLRGQAFLSPERTALLYNKVKAVADKYRVPVVGPNMAVGSPPGESITAFDPLENREIVYTFMVPFVKAFLSYADKAHTPVQAVGIHPYGPLGALRWATETASKEFGHPVWVTEFNNSDESMDMAAVRTFVIQAADYLERSPHVEGYAWFKERAEGHPKISLLAEEPGRLTPLGEAYVALPVHDADVYYRIPGRLPAENYVALDRMEIWPTDDADGFTHMTADQAGGWLDCNLQVDRPGTYTLRLRVAGEPGQISILKGERFLSKLTSSPERQWRTLETRVTLPAGPQTLRIRCESRGQSINWVEFVKR